MRFKKQWVAAVAAACLALTVLAQTVPSGDSGKGGGTGTGNSGSTASPPGVMGGMNPEMHSRMNTHMRAMQDVRARMSTATTLEQKQALMDEHMRLMDEHMSHMQSMMESNWSRPSDMYSPGSVL